MIVGVADTHAALWYLFADSRLSQAAYEFIEEAARNGDQVAVSAISVAEVVYLVEKGRLPLVMDAELTKALVDLQHVFTETAFTLAVAQSMRRIPRESVPDMPDRMIAATAVYYGVPIISRDRHIRSSELKTIW